MKRLGERRLQFPSLSGLRPGITPLPSPRRTLSVAKLIISLSVYLPHVCHPSRCLDHSFSLMLRLALPFSLHMFLCLRSFLTVSCFILKSYLTKPFLYSLSLIIRFFFKFKLSPLSLPHTAAICSGFALSASPLLSSSLSSVSSGVCGLCQVSSQPGGGGDLLGADCAVGQPQSPSDPCPEDSTICCCTHCKAGTQYWDITSLCCVPSDIFSL